MSKILDALLNYQGQGFEFFDQVILFGSSLWKDNPNDIDILLGRRCKTWPQRLCRVEAANFLFDALLRCQKPYCCSLCGPEWAELGQQEQRVDTLLLWLTP